MARSGTPAASAVSPLATAVALERRSAGSISITAGFTISRAPLRSTSAASVSGA